VGPLAAERIVSTSTTAVTPVSVERTSVTLTGISSMATRAVLASLCRAAEDAGMHARFESVGGVDAARRVRAGETFDLVVLAAHVLDALAAEGHVRAAGRRALMVSPVAIAVPLGAPRPDVGCEAALRSALLASTQVAHSTGPSGSALLALLERWGIAGQMNGRLVQAPPGTPVAALLASGRAGLGFQQLSELQDEPGVAVLGVMPPGAEIATTFAGAIGARSTNPAAAAALLEFFAAPAAAPVKRRRGMADAGALAAAPAYRTLPA